MPPWRVIRRGIIVAVVLAVLGAAMLLVGLTLPGAILICLGAVLGVMVPWIAVMIPAARHGIRRGIPPDAAVRNSDFGFLIGLMKKPGRQDPPPTSRADDPR